MKPTLLSLALVLIVAAATAREPIPAPPERLDFSAPRLERIDRLLEQAIADAEVAGAVALVLRDGETAYARALGMADREAGRPMRLDTVFRIASMTKAITSVAVMMLYEEGRFLLDDPIARFIPEFALMQVLVPGAGEGSDHSLVPAVRPITIRHLLTHTSGITYGFWGDEPITTIYREAGISDGLRQTEGTIGEMVKTLAGLPLVAQPGERYQYGLNTDVLGYLVEVVGGRPLDAFFRERIFAPLNMHDTGFRVAVDELPRLAAVYTPAAGGLERLGEDVITMGAARFSTSYHYRGPDRYFSGGAGLVSTAGDYGRFLELLRRGGELGGQRLLGPKTVELMTVDQLGDLEFWDRGFGFGLGFSVHIGPAASGNIGSAGEYAWGGFFNTRYWVDPKERLVAVLLTQRFPNEGVDLGERFRVAVYQALVD